MRALYLSLGLLLAFVSKVQSDEIKTFTHPNNPVTLSVSCKKVSDEELRKTEEEIRKRGPIPPNVTPAGFGPTWKLAFLDQFAGWLKCFLLLWIFGYGKDMYAFQQMGRSCYSRRNPCVQRLAVGCVRK